MKVRVFIYKICLILFFYMFILFMYDIINKRKVFLKYEYVRVVLIWNAGLFFG